jgi:hypothetical protein
MFFNDIRELLKFCFKSEIQLFSEPNPHPVIVDDFNVPMMN